MFRILQSFVLIMVLLPLNIAAQEEFNIEYIIQNALDSSHLLNSNDYLIQRAKTRNTTGFAGNLPSLDLNAQGQYDINSSRLEFFDGDVRNASAASNYNAGASIDATYPIYEAGAKNLRKNRLSTEVDGALINYKVEKQDIVLEVLQALSELELYQHQIETYQQDTAYWMELLDLREKMISFGKGTRVEIIQIQTELNRSATQLERAVQQYEMAKLKVEELAFISAEDSMQQLDLLSYLQRTELSNQNLSSPLLDQAQNDLRQAEISMELAKAMQFPVLSVFAGYGYNWSRNAVGVLLNNQNFGPYAGLRINWNIFDGHRTKTEIQSAKLQMASDRAFYNAVDREVKYIQKRFRTALERQQSVLQQEREQYELLQDQFQLIQEQYRQGRIDVLQVLNYQRELLLTQLNIASAEFQIRNYLMQILYAKGVFASNN